jgi:hypothetical protein
VREGGGYLGLGQKRARPRRRQGTKSLSSETSGYLSPVLISLSPKKIRKKREEKKTGGVGEKRGEKME